MKDLLFTKYQINNLEFKNRIMMLAMHLEYADNYQVTKRDMEFYRLRAKGGAASITVVAGVNPLSGPKGMHSVYKDEYLKGLKALNNMMNEYDCKMFIQLFHGGRNMLPIHLDGREPIAPSSVPSTIYKYPPKEMDREDIETTINDFAKGALRCKKHGIDGVEISCSAGYLLSQFLSPTVNKRTDEYGGSEENRMRFPYEVVKAIREAVGDDYPVILRVSASDMLIDGYDLKFMQKFVKKVETLVDAINVTGGFHEAPVPQITVHLPEGGYAYLAGAIKQVVDIPVIACNRINNHIIAEEILQSGLADFVGMARQFLIEPDFIKKIEKDEDYKRCIACNKGCIDRVLRLKDVKCALNPQVGLEYIGVQKAEKVKNILVVGGGPAGMQVTKTLSDRGHNVTLCTIEDKLGGTAILASKAPYKEGLASAMYVLEEDIKNRVNVDIKYNTKVNKNYIESHNPDHIVVATGSKPFIPNIPGINGDNVYLASEILSGDNEILKKIRRGRTIIIGGGAVGLETASFLIDNNYLSKANMDFINMYAPFLRNSLSVPNNITIIEMDKRVGTTMGGSRWIILEELKRNGVEILLETKVVSIDNGKVIVEKNGEAISIECENVIVAMGYRPNDELIEELSSYNIPTSVVGDSGKVREVMEALSDGYELGIRL
ncbi:FAD-dependent oxidoreductase [Tissierella praeacuta]|uniref:oxidoreductase n=1 Tax=Tissierella praeacuta TaxID=43131 RepID=UPI0035111DF0